MSDTQVEYAAEWRGVELREELGVKIKHHPKSVKKTAKAWGSVSEGY